MAAERQQHQLRLAGLGGQHGNHLGVAGEPDVELASVEKMEQGGARDVAAPDNRAPGLNARAAPCPMDVDVVVPGAVQYVDTEVSTALPDGHPDEAWAPGQGAPAAAKISSRRSETESNSKTSQRISRRTASDSDLPVPERSDCRKMSKNRAQIVKQSSKEVIKLTIEREQPGPGGRAKLWLRFATATLQKYSLPLICGVALALVWSNVDQHSYHEFIDKPLHPDLAFEGHAVSLHFVVNDVFMCFFFGLAIKEVTEALLPGGSLNPLSRAVNPLMATLGGVVGPVIVYAIMIVVLYEAGSFDGMLCVQVGETDSAGGHRLRLLSADDGRAADHSTNSVPCTRSMLLKGWGVPTATDISLAWMFALQVFGAGHPAINFMLLLAIVDDALGMIIIAVFYPDPKNPVKPLWLLLVLGAAALAFWMRKANVRSWLAFVVVCGPVSWYGLMKSHVHPALALVFVVPLMPANHAIFAPTEECNLGACDLGPERELDGDEHEGDLPPRSSTGANESTTRSPPPGHEAERASIGSRLSTSMTSSMRVFSHFFAREEEAPLHNFEESMKLPVDLGMFFFGLANAGVQLDSIGGMTAAVFVALIVGKTVGIASFSLLAVLMGFGLPTGLTFGDLFAMAAIAGVGLTVALFVANEAFIDPNLRGQAKMGAVFSIACGGVGWMFRRLSVGSACTSARSPSWQSEPEVVDLPPGWNHSCRDL